MSVKLCAFLAFLGTVLLPAHVSMILGQDLIMQKALSADMAMAIAQGALAECRANGYHATITVLDASNTLKAFIRDDGTTVSSVDISRRKAYTSLVYRRPSSEQLKSWNAQPQPVFIPEGAAPTPGGVPIKAGNEVIGAIGISGAPGGDKDESCAQAGIAKVSDKLK